MHDPHQSTAAPRARRKGATAAVPVLAHDRVRWPASRSSCWFTPFLRSASTTRLQRNTYLTKEIAKLDKQIDEIKKLKEQTAALLARKRVVETLQSNRTEAVHLLDQLVRQLPDGLYLKQVKQTGEHGQCHRLCHVQRARVHADAQPRSFALAGRPELVEIKAVKLNNANVNEFNLNVKVTRPKEETDVKPSLACLRHRRNTG